MLNREVIKNFYNQPIGYIETDSVTGDKVARDFYNRILGYYFKKENKTRDFYRRIISNGDTVASLIFLEEAKKQK